MAVRKRAPFAACLARRMFSGRYQIMADCVRLGLTHKWGAWSGTPHVRQRSADVARLQAIYNGLVRRGSYSRASTGSLELIGGYRQFSCQHPTMHLAPIGP